MLLWVVALAVRWPVSLSMGDEIGYVGQARLLLEGHIMPLDTTPGNWVPTTHGLIPKYPLFFPLLLAPVLALSPILLFATGVVAALAMTWVAGRVLASWGRPPFWALMFLAHPTVVILARAVMVDVLLTALAVGAWQALRRGRPPIAALLLALTVLAKPTGIPIVAALLVGEALRRRSSLLVRDQATIARLAWGAAGLGTGLALTVVSNFLTTGSFSSPYGPSLRYLPTPQFWPLYFPATAPVHLRTLLLMPPLLVLGAWPLARRREIGLLLTIVGFTLMMCFYFFVDRGPNLLETLVLAPRLILPVVAFLLLGYADGLAAWVARRQRLGSVAALVLVTLPALVALPVSIRHRRWQAPAGAALQAADEAISRRGENELGVGPNAAKVALLYRGRTVEPLPGAAAPGVILCSTRSASYRDPAEGESCAREGYDDQPLQAGFHLLTRHPSRAAVRPHEEPSAR